MYINARNARNARFVLETKTSTVWFIFDTQTVKVSLKEFREPRFIMNSHDYFKVATNQVALENVNSGRNEIKVLTTMPFPLIQHQYLDNRRNILDGNHDINFEHVAPIMYTWNLRNEQKYWQH